MGRSIFEWHKLFREYQNDSWCLKHHPNLSFWARGRKLCLWESIREVGAASVVRGITGQPKNDLPPTSSSCEWGPWLFGHGPVRHFSIPVNKMNAQGEALELGRGGSTGHSGSGIPGLCRRGRVLLWKILIICTILINNFFLMSSTTTTEQTVHNCKGNFRR